MGLPATVDNWVDRWWVDRNNNSTAEVLSEPETLSVNIRDIAK